MRYSDKIVSAVQQKRLRLVIAVFIVILLIIADMAALRNTQSEFINLLLYCCRCRKLLAKADTKGYVLADLYDVDSLKAFSIAKGAKYEIRYYTVSILQDCHSKKLVINVQGNI